MPFKAILFDKDGTLIDFDGTWGPAAYEVMRALAQGDAHSEAFRSARMQVEHHDHSLVKIVSAIAPSRTTMRGLGLACLLALGAFVLTMLKDPPKSVAFNPSGTIQPNNIKIQTGIPTGDWGSQAS